MINFTSYLSYPSPLSEKTKILPIRQLVTLRDWLQMYEVYSTYYNLMCN